MFFIYIRLYLYLYKASKVSNVPKTVHLLYKSCDF
jgi:hypothetical protein